MQTNFIPQQLEDPRIAEVESILRRCVHCGLCTATCSTYVVLGDERDSPRGRIYLLKDMFERGRHAGPEVTHHIDRCLSCLSCMTTCPGGVDYMHLVDIARSHIDKTARRPLKDRLLRKLLATIVPYPDRFRNVLKLAPMGQPFKGLMKRIGLPELAAMLELAPKEPVPKPTFSGPGTAKPTTERRARVILLAGCAQQVLRPEINDATIRLLARNGVDVEVAPNAGCCGALMHHMGKEEGAIEQAKRNVDAWSKLMESGPVDAIIINASGCGTTVKDYGHLLQYEKRYAERAKRISSLTRDISEFVSTYDLGPPKRWSALRVAYHSACSMQHGQRITDEPRALLSQAGYTVQEIGEGHICCGSAGTYNILQPDIANQLRERKVANIQKTRPDCVATGNIGCIMHLKPALSAPIVHTVELLDWAYGGPTPRGLQHLEHLVRDVPNQRTPEAYIN